jgi:outer membrane receptor protein involved in Fe transport
MKNNWRNIEKSAKAALLSCLSKIPFLEEIEIQQNTDGTTDRSFDKVFMQKTDYPNRFKEKRDLKSLYAPKAERILRVLLCNPGKKWKIKELAVESGVSLGQASNVKRILFDRELISGKRGEFSLTDPLTLLGEWAENYDYRKNVVQEFYSLKSVTDIENDLYRGVAGLEGVAGAWDWSAGVNYNRTETTLDGRNFVDLVGLDTAVNNNTINPLGTSSNSQAVLDEIRVPIGRKSEFELYGADAKASRDLIELDAGPIALAVGAEWRHEELTDEPDKRSQQGLVVGVATTSADGDRDVSALFAEVSVPLMERMELQVAGRHEDYSDFGNTTNPKVALRYQPIDQVVLRASWGKGFRAPSLAELYLGDTSSFDFLVDTTRCNAVGLGCDPDQYFIVTSGNEDLDAEESTSYYLGAVFEPVDDLTVGLDYWHYKVEDVIDQDAQFVVDNESQLGGVVRGPPSVPGDPGPILQVDDSFFNIAEEETDGIDLDIKYQWQAGEAGTFSIHELASRMLNFDRKQAPGASTDDLLGTYRFPKWRSVTTLAWMRGDYASSLTANYIDNYEDRFNPDLEVGSSLTFDVQFVYSGFANSDVTLGIENVTENNPPFANEEEGYDYATHDPRGRFFYARYKYAFN